MAEYNPNNFSKSPYFDDYDETKKFLRILFKPGRSVQARELTQLQSISQNQITRFSNHFFKEGSQVFDGQVADIKCRFLRIEKQYDGVDIDTDNFTNSTISILKSTETTLGDPITTPQRARILHIEKATAADPYHIFFIEYQDEITVNLEDGTVEGTPRPIAEYSNEDVLTKITYDNATPPRILNTQYRCTVKTTPQNTTGETDGDNIYTTGDAVLVSNDEGIFYVEGYFVLTPVQIVPLYKTARRLTTILGQTSDIVDSTDGVEVESETPPGSLPILSDDMSGASNFVSYLTDEGTNQNLVGIRLFQFPTAKVGFDITRQAVESTEDVTLLDNAFGSYNYSAPGGDRYKLELTLGQHAFPNIVNDAKLADYTTDDFLEKLRIVDGSISYFEKYPTYSNFEETLARRTYDESGNYTVRPFETEVREYFRDDRYVLTRSMPTTVGDYAPYKKDDIISGSKEDTNDYFTAIVVHDDAFLNREGERIHVDIADEDLELYGTTVIYLLAGTPTEGMVITLADGSGDKESKIITTDELIALDTGDSAYASTFTPIQLISDMRNGLYSLARLAPSTENGLDEVAEAKKKLALGMGTGKAYIFGYEFENQSVEYLTLPKSREVITTENQQIVNGIGNFLLCDVITGSDAPYRDPASQYYVELWGAVEGWVSDTDNGGLMAGPTLEKKGSARVRWVNYNFATNITWEDQLAQVYLYDVDMDLGKLLTDVSEVRVYNNDVPMFSVSPTWGVEELFVGNSDDPTDGSTILYDPKNNTNIFCLPNNNSVKHVKSLDSYETVKTVTNCTWTASGNHFYLESPTNQAEVYYIQLADYAESTNLVEEEWVLAESNNDVMPTEGEVNDWLLDNGNFAFNLFSTSTGDDDLDSLRVKYALLNEESGQVYDLSDTTKFLIGNHGDQDKKNKLTLWVNDETILDANITEDIDGDGVPDSKWTLIGSSIVSDDNEATNFGPTHIRTKTLKSIVDYRTELVWEQYFSTVAEDSLAGYYKVTLKNANVQSEYINSSVGPNWSADWPSALSTVGVSGPNIPGQPLQFFDGNIATLPREYVTSLGVSDVEEVTDILVWHTDDDGNENLKDIAPEFEFESGHGDNIYDHGKIIIGLDQLRSLYVQGYFRGGGPDATAADKEINATLYVRFKFFEHTGAGPLIVNSYIDDVNHHPDFDGYEDIPVHVSPLFGSTNELRNCVDFRPLRKNVDSETIAIAYDTDDPTLIDDVIYAPIKDNFIVGDAAGADKDSVTSFLRPMSIFPGKPHLPQLNYESYLPRMDKLILRKTREFDILAGEAGILPKVPEDDKDAMTLYSLIIPEYTYNAEDVISTYVDHQRYTMEDIAKLEKRIEKIEYYTSLNLLEKETSELSITDGTDGMERYKNGILVDNFKGHGVGDVLHRDYNCSIDFEYGELRPRFEAYNLNIGDPDNLENSKVVKSDDGILTLRYLGDRKDTDATSLANPPRWLVQPVASRAISVNPFNVTNWLGSIKLSPSSDTWKDTKTKPTVKINLEGENDAWEAMGERASGTQWNDWETTWTGSKIKSQSSITTSVNARLDAPHTRKAPDGRLRMRSQRQHTTVTKTTSVITKKQTRSGIRTTIIPERVTKNLGDRIIDVSIVPFIRTKVVSINGSMMKPNTQVYPFFDDIDVIEHCEYDGVSGGPIVTDDAGKITDLKFNIPAGIFKTGEREFRLTDSPTNNVRSAMTSAEANYFAQGLLQTKQGTTVSTRVPTIKRQSVSDSNVVRDVVTRTKTTQKNDKVKWIDPLAQTFLVDDQQEPNGVWVHSVDLFLANKPASGVPITVQIRPTVNGYPHSSMVLPFAEAVVDQVKVKTTKALTESTIPNPENADTYTRFQFSSPVFLIPGEYAIVVMSNSDEYECYIAEMGEQRVGPSTERITQQPYAGVFFKSQNGSTWSADQNVDLMFTINRCEFQGVDDALGTTLTFENDSIDEFGTGNLNIDTFRVVSENVQFEKAPLTLILPDSQEPEIANYVIPFNENINLSKTLPVNTDNSKFKLEVNIDTNDKGLSPVIDLDRFNLIGVNNIISESSNYLSEESAPFAPTTISAKNRPRYITRRVELEDGIECDDFKIYLTGHRPQYRDSGNNITPTDIRVWLKAQSVDDNRNFDSLPWFEMELDSTQEFLFSETDDEFFEYEYNVPENYYDVENENAEALTGFNAINEAFDSPIARYSFKITLHTGDSTYIPRVKNFRTIAVT